MSNANLTPLMKQYWDIKSLHPEPIVLFRMGDFYEMFFDDALKAAPILGIALTQRNKKGGDETPMCGFPHHSVAGPINRLLAAGFKVAICDQIEDPKLAKGIVKRAVTRILTPGMVYDLESLDGSRPNYIVSADATTLSFLDTSTGETFWMQSASKKDRARLLDVLTAVEVVLPAAAEAGDWPAHLAISRHEGLTARPHALLPTDAPESAARLISYVISLSGTESLRTLQPFSEKKIQSRLELSGTVLRHLEVFQTYKGEGTGSLFQAVNRTKTSAGSRLLRQWLSFPLREEKEIQQRLSGVEAWRARPAELKRVREVLGQMGDIERRLGKIPQPTCNGRDLQSLSASIEAGLSALHLAGENLAVGESLQGLASRVISTLVDEPPVSTKQGHLIRSGVRADLDELITLSTNAQSLLAQMEADEREKTGISSLKIRYNNVFGYYIEITHAHRDKAPARYQRKQTLANAERYCTEELLELERKVLSAQTRRSEVESEIFEELRRNVLEAGPALVELARRCSELDVLSAFAWLSLEENYVRPQFRADGLLELRASRHPVVEQSVRREFVPNDIVMDPQSCMLLTGPNMAGKSTLMRQVSLTALLAQAGSFVPAHSAQLPLFDSIYTRIGASDQLSEGLSTFMVEMTETAAMLKSATSRSLVILDEVGRGTSTFDGMCLAQAILEHLLSEVRCLTLFATHYHELTALEKIWPALRNAHMTVAERGGEIRFLHTLVQGPAGKSYGVQVAELAGLPSSITKRAKSLLREIESRGPAQGAQLSLLEMSTSEVSTGAEDFDATDSVAGVPAMHAPSPEELEKQAALRALVSEIRALPISQLTPLEALNRLARWQETCPDLS